MLKKGTEVIIGSNYAERDHYERYVGQKGVIVRERNKDDYGYFYRVYFSGYDRTVTVDESDCSPVVSSNEEYAYLLREDR